MKIMFSALRALAIIAVGAAMVAGSVRQNAPAASRVSVQPAAKPAASQPVRRARVAVAPARPQTKPATPAIARHAPGRSTHHGATAKTRSVAAVSTPRSRPVPARIAQAAPQSADARQTKTAPPKVLLPAPQAKVLSTTPPAFAAPSTTFAALAAIEAPRSALPPLPQNARDWNAPFYLAALEMTPRLLLAQADAPAAPVAPAPPTGTAPETTVPPAQPATSTEPITPATPTIPTSATTPTTPTAPSPSTLAADEGVALAASDLERLLAARPVVNQTLTLEEAVAIALRESPIIRGAAEEVEVALGRLNAARAERRPFVSANGFATGGNFNNLVQSPTLGMMPGALMSVPRGAFFDANLSLMFPLYTGGRLRTLVRQAEALRNASQAQLESQRQEVALLTRTAFREVQARRALVDVQRARLRENEEQLRLDRVRAQEGRIPPFFVLRQEAEVAATQQELTNAARDVELSLLQLKTVLGLSPASRLEVTGGLDYQPSDEFIARLSGTAALTPGPSPNAGRGVPERSEGGERANAAAPTVPAPATGSTAPGVTVPGVEVPGVQTPPVAVPGAPAATTAPSTPAPSTGSTVPAPGVPSQSTLVPGLATPGTSTATGLPAALGGLLRAAERGRPELRAAGLRITGAELEAAAIGLAYRPQVNAFVMGDVMKMRGMGASGGTTFGLAASIPIFTGGRRSAAVQTAEAERRRLQQERERIALDVAQSVEGAYLNLRAAEQNIATAQSALRSAQEDYRVARIRYESGRAVIVEVLDALAARTRAENNVVQALFGYNVARDQLLRAVGVLTADGGQTAPTPAAPAPVP